MSRILAILWLLAVAFAAAYLGWRVHDGLAFRTDLMALLPREEQSPVVQKANDTFARALSQKFVLLVGHSDRTQARAAALELIDRLHGTGLAEVLSTGFDKDRLHQMGALYFPYRRGLLADDVRLRLMDGKAEEVALQALSQVYGFVGIADARMLQNDPFLLMQSFFLGLPLPSSNFSLDDGLLTLNQGGMTWIMLAARLIGEPYSLDVQKHLFRTLDTTGRPGLKVLRLGAVFFAGAGAERAMAETSTLGSLSVLGCVLVVLLAFRALGPLWLSLLVIGVGVGFALATCLLLFGEIHVAALLFGVSLIGVAVDYSLQYCTEIFGVPAAPRERLKRVFAGISLGAGTAVIGYLTLFLAPFPGLHQIAAFSAIGLAASWLTVVLWLPRLDRGAFPRHGRLMLSWSDRFLSFWAGAADVRKGGVMLGVAILLAVAGATRFHNDDDVRHMQSLSSDLVSEQKRVQNLIGSTAGNQFFLVQGADDEICLQREEKLIERLRPLVAAHAMSGFLSLAQFVPSAARQMENRRLLAAKLDPLAVEQANRLGLSQPLSASEDSFPPLKLEQAVKVEGPLAFLSTLLLEPGLHVVSLEGVSRMTEVMAAADGLEGVRFIDPTAQYSLLLEKYRVRAIGLLVPAAVLMALLLVWRYGLVGAVRVMTPPLLATAMTPALRALAGGTFTFFDAMGLILILAIGMDYAVFCAETTEERKRVTILAVALAAMTALLGFGLLASSSVAAVHSFGTTMLVGIFLAFLFAPLAHRERRDAAGH